MEGERKGARKAAIFTIFSQKNPFFPLRSLFTFSSTSGFSEMKYHKTRLLIFLPLVLMLLLIGEPVSFDSFQLPEHQ